MGGIFKKIRREARRIGHQIEHTARPVIKAAPLIAATVITAGTFAPVAATALVATGLGATAVSVVGPAVSMAVASGAINTVAGVRGRDLTKSIIVGGIGGGAGAMAAAAPTITQTVAISAGSGAVTAAITGGNPIAGAVAGGVGSAIHATEFKMPIVQQQTGAAIGAAAGALVTGGTNPLNAAIMAGACGAIASITSEMMASIQQPIQQVREPDPNTEAQDDAVKQRYQKAMREIDTKIASEAADGYTKLLDDFNTQLREHYIFERSEAYTDWQTDLQRFKRELTAFAQQDKLNFQTLDGIDRQIKLASNTVEQKLLSDPTVTFSATNKPGVTVKHDIGGGQVVTSGISHRGVSTGNRSSSTNFGPSDIYPGGVQVSHTVKHEGNRVTQEQLRVAGEAANIPQTAEVGNCVATSGSSAFHINSDGSPVVMETKEVHLNTASTGCRVATGAALVGAAAITVLVGPAVTITGGLAGATAVAAQ